MPDTTDREYDDGKLLVEFQRAVRNGNKQQAAEIARQMGRFKGIIGKECTPPVWMHKGSRCWHYFRLGYRQGSLVRLWDEQDKALNKILAKAAR